MGNVSGREDGLGSSSGIEEDGVGGGGDGTQDSMAGPYEARSYYVHTAPPPEAIAQSPPTSPRATQSPLMFSPQVPIAPLQRPDEMHASTRSWMENSPGYDDMCAEHVIPTMITWSYGGKEVSVEGSWDNWRVRMPLERSGKDFTIMKVLPSGVYQYRFIVDGQWKYAPDLPWAQDGSTPYNILDLQDSVPEDLESISSFVPPQSPDSSYSNLFLGAEDFAKEPPMVPPHLQVSLLNVPSVSMEIPALTRPPHVVLNHLYMHKGKSNPSVLALGSTHRFLAKYVTVVLYKPLHSENPSFT